MERELPFETNEPVKGLNLITFLEWARASFEWGHEQPPHGWGLLALPAIQRNPAWNPRQVVEVWDSVFRGLPLGAFMLQQRGDGSQGRGAGTDARITDNLPKGWDLLDGQQRMRSLLLGLYGPNLEPGRQDKRCLWLDLDAASDRYLFDLRLTSASQPFGYKEDGYKFAPAVRTAARLRFEGDDQEIRKENRQAYSHELFEGFIGASVLRLELANGHTAPMPPANYPAGWPPIPESVGLDRLSHPNRSILPLHDLLRSWIHSTKSSDEFLRTYISNEHPRFVDLRVMLERIKYSTIALIDASSVERSNLPVFYDRIGAGGTRISEDERLFSFYKSYQPAFHNVVQEIYEDCGQIMLPSRIATTAIRVANAQAHYKRDLSLNVNQRQGWVGNVVPDVASFAKALVNAVAQGDRVDLRTCLDELTIKSAPSPIAALFKWLVSGLAYGEQNVLGLPKIMLEALPRGLLHVLIFWRLQTNQNSDEADNHLPRFAIFWLLCCRDENKVSSFCFRMIREVDSVSFKAMFDALISEPTEQLCRKIITPSRMRRILERWEGLEQPELGSIWRNITARTNGADWMEAEFIKRWWWDSANILPWLQRAYLHEAFSGYDPTADREDDTPYDVDHMVPRNDWGFDWRDRSDRLEPIDRFDKPSQTVIRDNRFDIGNSIGNKWLVDFSTNRAWSDQSFTQKLDDITSANELILTRLQDVFPRDSLELWKDASPVDWRSTPWSDERMRKFQKAVEARAAWLYQRMYGDLKFFAWVDDAD
jgi:hypothetical protein